MLLAVDIGNTTVSFGVLKGKRIIQTHLLEVGVSQVQLQSDLKKILNRIKRTPRSIEQVVICSVAPKIFDLVVWSVVRQLKIRPAVIGKDIKVPIKNNYRNPRQVGQDRLVGAYAAKCLYGKPVIIIDFGTAITFDVVSRKGHYEGGMIVPGIGMSTESLFQKTALLPNIKSIKKPRTLIGKDTEESILSGIFFGYGSLCSGLIDQISKRIKGKPKIIVTGGHTHLMKKFIASRITKIDKSLVFKGLALLMEKTNMPSRLI